jgi:hypothetical protein
MGSVRINTRFKHASHRQGIESPPDTSCGGESTIDHLWRRLGQPLPWVAA